jgi:hypothetical protein
MSGTGVMALSAIHQDGRFLAAWGSVLTFASGLGMILDLCADARAFYRNPTLTPVWLIHHVQLVDFATRALQRRGIDVHVRGLNVRKLYHFFAPFVPMTLHVPADRVDEAKEVLASFLPLDRPEKSLAEGHRELNDQASPA